MDWQVYRKMDKINIPPQNYEMWELVKPDDDRDWEFRFTEMSEFDKIFQKITSVPNWKEDKSLVYLFNVMLQRKHKYFNEALFEEDKVIVPSLQCLNQPKPSTEGLTEEQGKLFLLVHNFIASAYCVQAKAVYDYVLQQFDTVKDWKNKPIFVNSYEQVKRWESMMSEKIRPKAPQIEQKYNESIKAEAEKWVNTNKKKIEEYISPNQEKRVSYLENLLSSIHRCRNWRHNETLRKWNGLLGAQLRILKLQKQGSWQSRIVHKQSPSTQTGLISWMWAKIWTGKEDEKAKNVGDS